ncbi:MAG: nucleotide exchange factor GrpE [Candidatus Komeilibacteria bacterium CG10_big_fil_rev_8_21_14_0_10_41_13]|uniref:Protein GrpE n=1 Tax=Candidatus Komeilibacteria bacterium CG10_big_fil_rev_8_21_14_0_10_41_13 TaxID=1974476 RepID=A0A2M6WBK9_9BACT|nr:MAG: nucleotide exchange factor GrpE [Candidatus Komeilibacteria bacterium CG10_big_fil_rev_8_21_14_0_10_41_13]
MTDQEKLEDELIEEQSEDEEEGLADKCQEYLQGWQRAKADYENLKKETDRKLQEMASYQQAGLLLEVLPIYDHFKMALSHIPEEQQKADWIQGIHHIKKQFENLLNNLGIEEVKTMGQQFNPELHEAIAYEDSDQADNQIIREVKTGYKLKGRLIQPAQVVVAKNNK